MKRCVIIFILVLVVLALLAAPVQACGWKHPPPPVWHPPIGFEPWIPGPFTPIPVLPPPLCWPPLPPVRLVALEPHAEVRMHAPAPKHGCRRVGILDRRGVFLSRTSKFVAMPARPSAACDASEYWTGGGDVL